MHHWKLHLKAGVDVVHGVSARLDPQHRLEAFIRGCQLLQYFCLCVEGHLAGVNRQSITQSSTESDLSLKCSPHKYYSHSFAALARDFPSWCLSSNFMTSAPMPAPHHCIPSDWFSLRMP